MTTRRTLSRRAKRKTRKKWSRRVDACVIEHVCHAMFLRTDLPRARAWILVTLRSSFAFCFRAALPRTPACIFVAARPSFRLRRLVFPRTPACIFVAAACAFSGCRVPIQDGLSKRHTRCQRGETAGRREGSVGCLNVGDLRQLFFGGLLGAPKPGRTDSARRPRCHQQLTALVDPGLHSGVDRIAQSLVP